MRWCAQAMAINCASAGLSNIVLRRLMKRGNDCHAGGCDAAAYRDIDGAHAAGCTT